MQVDFRNIATIAITFLVMLTTLIPTAITLDYKIRNDFYVKVLCENKNKPELKCKGACQIRRAMKNGSKAADEFTSQFKLAPATIETSHFFPFEPITFSEFVDIIQVSHPVSGYAEPALGSSWQPPCV